MFYRGLEKDNLVLLCYYRIGTLLNEYKGYVANKLLLSTPVVSLTALFGNSVVHSSPAKLF